MTAGGTIDPDECCEQCARELNDPAGEVVGVMKQFIGPIGRGVTVNIPLGSRKRAGLCRRCGIAPVAP